MSPRMPVIATPAGRCGTRDLELEAQGFVLTTAYAVVQDVPASWSVYLDAADSLGAAVPDGLLFRVAGPTDEGFRVIDVWESQAACQRFDDGASPGLLDGPVTARHLRTTFRDLVAHHLFQA